MRRLILLALLSLAALAAATPVQARATTLHVTNGENAGPGTLRAQIAAAAGGDMVIIDPGVATVTLTSGEVGLDKELTIEGQGESATAIDAGHRSRIFNIGSGDASASVVIRDLTLTRGRSADGTARDSGGPPDPNFHYAGEDGGAVLNRATLSLDHVTISESRAGDGGPGSPTPGFPSQVGGGGGHGGAIANAGTLTVESSTLSGNRSGNGGLGGDGLSPFPGDPAGSGEEGGPAGAGGAISNSGTLTVTASTFADNSGGTGGRGGAGGRVLYDGQRAGSGGPGGTGGAGGAIASGGSLTVTTSTFSQNLSGTGGAGGVAGMAADVGGRGGNGGDGGAGGALWTSSTTTITDSTLAANKAGFGGAGATGSMTISPTDATAGDGGTGGTGGNGGAIANAGPESRTVALERVTIADNVAGAGGNGGSGGDPSQAEPGTNNREGARGAGGTGGNGGGFASSGALIVRDSAIAHNTAGTGGFGSAHGRVDGHGGDGGDGGGGFDFGAGHLTVTNSTFAGNAAGAGGQGSSTGSGGGNDSGDGGDGGGVFIGANAMNARLLSTTIALNHAGARGEGRAGGAPGAPGGGGGITVPPGANLLVVENMLLAGNGGAGGANCFGKVSTNGNNLAFVLGGGNGGCGLFSSFADPKLDPAGLADNGGPTQTIALMPGSAAIDGAFSNSCRDAQGVALGADQRGAPRADAPHGCDLGAFEVVADPPETAIDSGPGEGSATNVVDPSFAFSGAPTGIIVGFECRLDSSDDADWQACSSPKEYTSLDEGAHTFEVRAVGAGGHLDATPATRTFTIDTTAPETEIDSGPAAGSSTNDPSPSFGFSSSASDVARFECRLDSRDDTDWEACASPSAYVNLGDGAHAFGVRAVDDAGNVDATPPSRAFSIDTVAPTVSIDGAPAAESNDDNPSFAYHASKPGSSLACRIDGAGCAPCPASGQRYSDLGDGAHEFQVRATDPAGNTGPSVSVGFAIDTVAPTAKITRGPKKVTKGRKAKFRLAADDPSALLQCKVDKKRLAPCTSPLKLKTKRLRPGKHVLRVIAVDAVGNTQPAPAKKKFRVIRR